MARGRKPKGLGDVIENVTESTGIKKVVEKISEVTGIDCGCNERKEWLNKKFRLKANCLENEDVIAWKEWRELNKQKIDIKDQTFICDLLRKGYNMSIAPCSSCGASTWLQYIKMIDELTK